MSHWNLFLDRLIEVGPNLTQEEWRLAVVLARCVLGWYATEELLGETLLRKKSRLHGRSFDRARAGLVAKGVIRYTPPVTTGRGHRGRYELILSGGEVVGDPSVAA